MRLAWKGLRRPAPGHRARGTISSVYSALRALLFKLDPETAHHLTLSALALAGLPPARPFMRAMFGLAQSSAPVRAFGLTFPNAIGVAAGYDKDGAAWRGLATMGFGHVEVGTVTPRPQPGNPRPRVFRLPDDRALINRMGFPSAGADAVAARLRRRRPGGVILGANVGKNRDTPLERAGDDYAGLVQTFAPLADYIAINVSSPNTEGLRRLQAKDAMAALLRRCVDARAASGDAPPMLVKLAPDLTIDELDDAVDVALELRLDGVILTNTTVSRDGLRAPASVSAQKGGLSGAPLAERSTAFIRHVHRRTSGALPIIGVGGVDSPEAAMAKLDAGATLIQVYTGLVYAGPLLPRRILDAIAD